jgi:cellulose synthase/poly-beta-1,6-N-acetylglucosamine synthase-like glycosyltransferase
VLILLGCDKGQEGKQGKEIRKAMNFINGFNLFVFAVLTLLYFYQMIYVIVALVGEKKKEHFNEEAKKFHRYAFVVAARNESAVIGNLIKSIRRQNYPAGLIDVIVIADNCTDNTAEIARSNGAIVFERFNHVLVGKGYALDYCFNRIENEMGGVESYDGYFIFDADNIIDRNYVREMNKVFDKGYRVITSYRNSKNYDSNWISAGYALWFLREAKFLNNPRMMMNTNCAVSGTGFLMSSAIVKANGGWKYHLLTEDIEFSIVSAIKGERIGYCEKAILYDEQPTSFKQSWNQRLRWSKGFYQVTFKYAGQLLSTMFKKRERFTSCYDMLMTIAPATLLTIVCCLVNITGIVACIIDPSIASTLLPVAAKSLLFTFVNMYTMLFVVGLLTIITESSQIRCGNMKKILYLFMFPIYIFTYIPIAIVALFKKVEWKPIAHNCVMSVEDVQASRVQAK